VLGEAMVEISVREYGGCVWLLVGRNDGDRLKGWLTAKRGFDSEIE
jgi:hypothetical protein